MDDNTIYKKGNNSIIWTGRKHEYLIGSYYDKQFTGQYYLQEDLMNAKPISLK